MHILSEIKKADLPYCAPELTVGEGLAPPEITVNLTSCGKVAKEQFQLLEKRFPYITVDDYIIIFLNEQAGGASPSPTLNNIICAFKSLTARI